MHPQFRIPPGTVAFPNPAQPDVDPEPAGFGDALGLRGHLRTVRAARWRILGAGAVASAVMFGVATQQEPVYEADATVLVERPPTDAVALTSTNIQDRDRLLRTEVEFARSGRVQDAVDAAVGYDAALSASTGLDADVIVLRARHTDAEVAARTAATYARTFIDARRAAAVAGFSDTSRHVAAELDRIDDELAVLRARAERATGDAADALADEIAALEAERDIYADARRQLQLGSAVSAAAGATLITDADVPAQPVSPTPRRDAVVGLLGGAMLAAAAAIARAQIDDRVRGRAALETAAGRPVLAAVPVDRDLRRRDLLAMVAAPQSPAAEAYRTLRFALQFMTVDRQRAGRGLGVLVTSTLPGDGKTTTAANLAVALAQGGARVVVVGTDLRLPRIHRLFGRSDHVGVTDVLVGTVAVADALVDTDIDGLTLLPAGRIPPNPAELLDTAAFAAVVDGLRDDFDYVVFDAAPLLAVSDALALARHADVTLLVVADGKVPAASLSRAVAMLDGVGGRADGLVLNATTEDTTTYSYGYTDRFRRSWSRRAGRRAARIVRRVR